MRSGWVTIGSLAGGLVVLTACSTGQVGSLDYTRPAGLSGVTLQFAVGTATIASASGVLYGTNFVATFRQSSGASATLANTPTVTGPGGLMLTGATPSQAMVGNQNVFLQPFGDTIGVFGSGFAPLNISSSVAIANYKKVTQNSDADSYDCDEPSTNPPFSTISSPLFPGNCPPTPTTPPTYRYSGGPPAFPSSQGYGYPAGFTGYSLGFMDFSEVAPAAGSYTLDVAVPLDVKATVYQHFDATATLKAVQLPPLVTPSITFPGDGSAQVSFNVPPGVTEAIVSIQTGPCVLPTSGVEIPQNRYYAVVTHQTGQNTLAITSNLGPPDANGNPTHTFCTPADRGNNVVPYSIGYVGFDYPAYESLYPHSKVPNPKITTGDGYTGTADITTAIPIIGNNLP